MWVRLNGRAHPRVGYSCWTRLGLLQGGGRGPAPHSCTGGPPTSSSRNRPTQCRSRRRGARWPISLLWRALGRWAGSHPALALASTRYQRLWYALWLTSRLSAGLGGVLADDMGLGKTVQIPHRQSRPCARRRWERPGPRGRSYLCDCVGGTGRDVRPACACVASLRPPRATRNDDPQREAGLATSSLPPIR